MIARAHARPALALALLAALPFAGGGCSSGEKRTQKTFDRPQMPAVPARRDVPIDDDLQRRAAATIATAFASKEPVQRAQSLEAMARTRDPDAEPRVMVALQDPEAIVRFAGAFCAGDLRLAGTNAALLDKLDDPSANVRVAVRYALHRLGDTSHSHDFETLAQNPNARVRANVALCVGLLGEPTGVRLLRPMLGDPDDAVRLAAAEGLWSLGDADEGLKNLVAGTVSPFPDEQIVCTLALARPRDPVVKDHIVGKLAIQKDDRQYVELQLAAARALGWLGDDEGDGVAIAATRSKEARQRSMAALALGAIRRPDAQPALARLLDDPDPEVRLSAALAIRQLPLPAAAR